ncbi:17762_t:CDS:2, partial [Racocetra persica]
KKKKKNLSDSEHNLDESSEKDKGFSNMTTNKIIADIEQYPSSQIHLIGQSYRQCLMSAISLNIDTDIWFSLCPVRVCMTILDY